MRILLVDGDGGRGVSCAAEFKARGHDVVECFRDDDQMCVGVVDASRCPVESLGCDVTVVVGHDDSSPRLREMGSLCAARRHLPLVDSTTVSGDLIAAVEALDAGSRPRLVEAVEQRLRTVPAIVRHGRVPTVAVRYAEGRLVMTIDLPQGLTRSEEEAVVTWAVRALRESDPHTLTADIIVHGRNRG